MTAAEAMRDSRTLRQGLLMMLRGCRDHPIPALIALSSSAINGTCMVLGAKAVGWATDHVIVASFEQGRFLAGAAGIAAVFVMAVSLLRIATIIIRGVGSGMVEFRNQAALRKQVTDHYLRLSVSWHRTRPTGQLVSHVVSDVETAWDPMQHFPFAVGMTVMLLLVMVNVALTDLWLALIAFVLIPVVLATNFAYQRVLAPRAHAAQQQRADVSALAHESIAGEQVIRTLGIADHQVGHFAEAAEKLRSANRRMGNAGAVFDPAIELMPPLAALIILAVGAARISSGHLGIGALVEVIYLLITTAIPLNVLGRFLGVLPLGVAGHERVQQILAADVRSTSGSRRLDGDSVPVGIGVHGADFAYAAANAVHDVSLTVAPGAIVAVVGRTGAGKSTTLALLARLLEPGRGSVSIDGVDARELDCGEISRRTALVTQSAFVFADSVRDNVTLGVDADDTEVWRALRVAGASEFVRRLPRGLDAELGESAQLSGGQRQRIALARAVFRRPGLLLLDDATSALDPVVERDVVDGLRSEYASDDRPTTVVLVGHRAATIALADRVCFLERGRVIAEGSHEELLENVPAYRSLLAAYDPTASEQK